MDLLAMALVVSMTIAALIAFDLLALRFGVDSPRGSAMTVIAAEPTAPDDRHGTVRKRPRCQA